MSSTTVAPIPLNMLEEHPDNPRTSSWDLVDLVASIRQHGVLTPCIVRSAGENRFQILAGHRRFRAAQVLGLDSIPCRITTLPESESWEILLAENIQRRNLNLIEEARAYKALRTRGLTILAIANRLNCSEQRISRRLALLELEPGLQEQVASLNLSMREAWAFVDKSRQAKRGPKVGEGGRSTKWNEHLNQGHMLADQAGTRCDAEGHDIPKRLGPACAACWEEAIRDDQHLATQEEMVADEEADLIETRGKAVAS